MQTPEICLATVKENDEAVRFVKQQTEESAVGASRYAVCLAAVQTNGWALEYVKVQTPEICVTAASEQDFPV
uniref:DUF4116 domain-containing protein n=1 Tax=Marseillevirus LCMAC201 TaxID=2506605 RepID=A0A481YY47_9VIRU|nr:MAG: protein of unknown function DUF4116 [Marseillevirus LCMAC201]